MRLSLAVLLAAVLLLAGCTGTEPDPVRVVLAIGVDSGPSGGDIQLYSQLIQQDASATQPIERLDAGGISLGNFTPVALDVADSTSPSILAALASDGSTYQLNLFDVSGLRLDEEPNPSSLGTDRKSVG